MEHRTPEEQRIDQLELRVKELEAIVNRLPRAADGEPITPGQELYFVFRDGVFECTYLGTEPDLSGTRISAYSEEGVYITDSDKAHFLKPMLKCAFTRKDVADAHYAAEKRR